LIVDLAVTEERAELRRSVRRLLEERSPVRAARGYMESPDAYDRALWSRMAGELGLHSLHLPEEYGGQGFSLAELVVVLEEMGRVLLCAPFFATVCLGANAILNGAGDAQRRALLPGIAAGETVATLALTEADGRWEPEGIATEAVPDGGGWRIRGTKTFVVDGLAADLLVTAARRPGTTGVAGVSLFVVRGDAPGLLRTPLSTMDQTRRQARIDLDGVRAELLGEEGDGWRALSTTLDQAAVCLAAEMVGGADRCLEMSVDYAKTRVQFGRPIGSFQAIKHKCADMLVEVESARSAVAYAGWAAAEDPGELPVAASMAKAYCSDVYVHAAAETIQIHGGIGFTWEHDAHLYFRRAKSSEVLLGGPSHHRELLAQRVGI
jgi:alkylation response protein AidB-like acyl-CoA dehydrogenase